MSPFPQTARVRFLVLVEGSPRPVELVLGSATALRSISRWRAPMSLRDEPAVRDSLEFARLASKRHRQYLATLPTAFSLPELQRTLVQRPQAEIALMFSV